MLTTTEVSEDRSLGAVTRTQDLFSTYFIMTSMPPVSEAIVVTIMGWKGHNALHSVFGSCVSSQWIPRIRGYHGTWIMANWSSSTWFTILTSIVGVSLVMGPLIIYHFKHQKEDIIADGQLLSKNHKMVNAVFVAAWIYHCLLKELSSSQ